MEKLYKFNFDCGRMGSLNGLFVEDEVDIQNAVGKYVYFGEVLGKHSEVSGTLELSDFKVLTDDQEFIHKFLKYGCESGYNPLHYLEEDEEEDDNYYDDEEVYYDEDEED